MPALEPFGAALRRSALSLPVCSVTQFVPSPTDALLDSVGIQFIGVFECLDKLCRGGSADAPATPESSDSEDIRPPVAQALPLRVTSRFYYDPPEVQAFAVFPKQCPRHWGMFRDSPTETPSMVVESDAARGNTFTPMCDGVLGAVCHLVRGRSAGPPSLVAASKALHAAAVAAGVDPGARTHAVGRGKAALAPTLSGLGIVVPYDKATELGFRPLRYTRPQLIKVLDGVLAGSPTSKASLEETRTFAHIANDECDFGNGLLLGLELWGYHPEFTHAAVEHLSMAYTLLNRGGYGEVLKEVVAHRDHTRGGPRVEVDSAIAGAAALKRKRK